MCTVAAALGVAAIGTQVVGGIFSAPAAKEKGEADAAYFSHLAGGARKQAKRVLETARVQTGLIATGAARETTAVREYGERVRGAQKAGFAAAGVGGGSVTGMDVALDTLEREQQDEELIRHNANVAAWETNNQAAMAAQGLISQAEASIIGGAANVAGTGSRMAYYGGY
jgi:hypothetical protein